MDAPVSPARAKAEADLIVALRDLSLEQLVWLADHAYWLPEAIHIHDVEIPQEYLRSRGRGAGEQQ